MEPLAVTGPDDFDRNVERLVREAKKKFGKRTLPSDSLEFIELVYKGRARLLGHKPVPVTPEIRAFVKERLSRCGLEVVSADAPSVAEIWDIFDDYEFHQMMGHKP